MSKFTNYRFLGLAGLSLVAVAVIMANYNSSTSHDIEAPHSISASAHKDNAVLPLSTTTTLPVKSNTDVNPLVTDAHKTVSTTPEKAIEKSIISAIGHSTSNQPSYQYIIKPGDTLSEIFTHEKIPYSVLDSIISADRDIKIADLSPGNVVRFWIDKTNHQLTKFQVQFNLAENIEYTLTPKGNYEVKKTELPSVWHDDVITGTIHGSFLSSAKKAGLQYDDATQIINILQNTLNFNHLKTGDKFDVVTKNEFIGSTPTGDNKILAVRIDTKKDVISAYRDANGNFYDQHGNSLQSALLRWPTAIHYRITSPFSLARVNPVSGILEPHYGVDIGAPSGTHVLATGTGVVTRVAYQKYAGNYINIRYNKTYSARFLHNSRILVKKGEHVKRGQVIALSGATGEVTGPHVHYELHIDGKPVNPMTAKIPLATSLPQKEKYAFEERVTQYNKMMSKMSDESTSDIKLANK